MNNFEFNDQNYLQRGGTAMGTRLAPSYAILFMGNFEEKFDNIVIETTSYLQKYWLKLYEILTHRPDVYGHFGKKNMFLEP